MRGRAALVAALMLLAGPAARANDPEASALALADLSPATAAEAGDWRTFAEGAFGGARRRDGGGSDPRRLSLDIRFDHSFSGEWRAVAADRLDADWPAQQPGERAINTLKEAYLSWRLPADTLFDFGRINARYGVATGYNPTDHFRRGALRSVVSISPASLKENRQGSLMLRGQRLWESGALTALYSPKLGRPAAGRDGFDPDWGATNPENRWLLALSQRIGTLAPQFLLYREEGLPPQAGLNLSSLVDDATVAYLEWSGGRAPSLLAQALAEGAGPGAFRNRLSAGLTHTTPGNFSLTAEFEYNGGGLEREAWSALRQGPPAVYGQYRNWLQSTQELPTRQALFFLASWRDALVNRLELSAMLNFDIADSSRRTWLEARYPVERYEFAVQWQRNGGGRLSDFGAAPESRGWQAVLRYYF